MQELVDAIEKAVDVGHNHGEGLVDIEKASIIWAEFCLKTFRGELLKAGLEISRTMAEFMCEMQLKD